MNCQILFSGKNKKNITNLVAAELVKIFKPLQKTHLRVYVYMQRKVMTNL